MVGSLCNTECLRATALHALVKVLTVIVFALLPYRTCYRGTSRVTPYTTTTTGSNYYQHTEIYECGLFDWWDCTRYVTRWVLGIWNIFIFLKCFLFLYSTRYFVVYVTQYKTTYSQTTYCCSGYRGSPPNCERKCLVVDVSKHSSILQKKMVQFALYKYGVIHC